MPAIGALDYPPARRMAGRRRRRLGGRLPTAALAGRLHHVAARLGGPVGLGEVEALIPTQVLRVPGGRSGARDYHAVQDRFGQLHVGAIRRAEHDAQGRAAPVVEDMPFGAQFAPIGRVRARGVAAEGGEGTVALSVDCQSQPMRCAAS